MRTTPALALVAAFLATSVIAAPQGGIGHAPAQLHRRGGAACKISGRHHHHHGHHKHGADKMPAGGDDTAPAPAPDVDGNPTADPAPAPAGDFGAPADGAPASGGNSPTPAPGSDASTPGGDAPTPVPASATPDQGDAPATPGQGDAPVPAPAVQGDASGSLPTDKKMRKKKHKGKKCALNPKVQGQGQIPGQGQPGQSPIGGGAQGEGTPTPGSISDQGSQGNDKPLIDGVPDQQVGGNPPTDDGSVREGYGDEGAGYQPPNTQPGGSEQDDGSTTPVGGPPDQGSGAQPGNNPGGSVDQPGHTGSDGQDQQGYSPNTPPNQPGKDDATEQDKDHKGVYCTGTQGSTTLPTNGKVKHHWFDPSLIHHGPGTTFGGGDFWQGGACMFNDLPHHNLPSVAMDQAFFQDGLACGTCVEIASTSASLFSNSAKWSVEPPKKGTLPEGKKTIAIVSDLCPGIDQCWSGLDMHPDTWNSVTNGAAGTKLPINWRFVNCKEAFEKSGSGIKLLQIHWREGANPGFFQVQIRGNHEAVVRVEMKWGSHGWAEATHVDNGWWKWESQQPFGFDTKKDKVTFRITDWQGQTLTSEKPTLMNTDLFFKKNFERVESNDA
ncbi:uncharacterized protein UTRI_00981_B [Ustilago trichophora]|uniref:Expansin-like EG45 domain-containing protein n=1 Tax=Ustilago trichophora TaxID=86804 RepID=A0A5C3DSU1_9BASI|nr:uncharacterized protein UTRI_00981_B [Ustilago trichophora]